MTRYQKFLYLLNVAISCSALSPDKAVAAVAEVFNPNVETNINLGDLDQPVGQKVMEYWRFLTVAGTPKPGWLNTGEQA